MKERREGERGTAEGERGVGPREGEDVRMEEDDVGSSRGDVSLADDISERGSAPYDPVDRSDVDSDAKVSVD